MRPIDRRALLLVGAVVSGEPSRTLARDEKRKIVVSRPRAAVPIGR
jgi:hypothetical protein